uniref:Uncharacterized protein n=1 Tax=Physcomitrium patens TaxID=3218 RepID=A0A2K1K3L3_PHYPA|nr:hypothetical protein PHYPA_012844 [Physcomitrium patens]
MPNVEPAALLQSAPGCSMNPSRTNSSMQHVRMNELSNIMKFSLHVRPCKH